MLYVSEFVKTKSYPINKVGRDFVVGDIHGEYKKFIDKLAEVNFDKSVDRMFSVGDLVDRGPESELCLKLVDEEWFYSVKGNHEDMMVGGLLENDNSMLFNWYRNGGNWARDSELTHDQLQDLARKARDLPTAINVYCHDGKMIGICHAQPPKSYDWDDITDPFSETMMLWGRTRIKLAERHVVDNVTWTFHGHTPVAKPVHLGNTTFLDTGACFDPHYPLTVMKFADKGVLESQFKL